MSSGSWLENSRLWEILSRTCFRRKSVYPKPAKEDPDVKTDVWGTRKFGEIVEDNYVSDVFASVRATLGPRGRSSYPKPDRVQSGISFLGYPESPQGRVRLLEDPGTHGPKSACPGSVGTREAADVPGNRSWALREREESFICRFACPDGSPRRGLQVFG